MILLTSVHRRNDGASLSGMRPIVVPPDGLYVVYVDAIVNEVKWRHMTGGQAAVPVTIDY